MSRATIAIDSRYITAPLSGIGRYALNLLSGLAGLTPPHPIHVLVAPAALLPHHVRAAPHLNFITVPGSPYRLRDQWTLPDVLRRHQIGLLHSLDVFAPLRAWQVRKVITIYDLIPLVCRRQMPGSRKAQFSFLWRQWLQLQCRAAAGILTISQASARDIQRELGVAAHRITVVAGGIAPPAAPAGAAEIRSALGLETGVPYALYVGRRDPYKNIVRLIEAFAVARQRLSTPLHLVIAGAADRRFLEPEAAVARLGLAGRIRFLGHVSDDQLAALHAGAAVFAFPSLYEGQGLPPLEAMAAGVPVIASNRAAIPEVVGTAAVLVDPLNVTEMAEALVRILTDPVLATDLIRRGRLQAAPFTPQRQAAATLACYQQMVSA